MATAAGGSYTFQSEPKAVTGQKKYRDPGQTAHDGGATILGDNSNNIHFDKRVYRGNTYSSHHRKTGGEDLSTSTRSGTMGASGRRPPRQQTASVFDMGLPRPERMPVDLLPHLVEEVKVVVETATETQTDEFMPEVPAQEYVPRKTGIDRTTQVEDGDLFNFDMEVEPLLDVLVNKTMEQALMEVEEEHELKSMAVFKEQWYDRQQKQSGDWEQLVEEERRRQVEKDVKLKLARQAKRRETTLLLKLQAIAAADSLLPKLGPNAVDDLMADNLFPNATLLAIQSEFLPGLFEDAVKEVAKRRVETELVDGMLLEVATSRQALKAQKRAEYEALLKRRQEEEEARRIAEAKKLGKIRINYEGQEIGPIAITKDDDIPGLHEKVFAWLQENNPELAALMPDGVELMVDEAPAADVSALFDAAKADPGSIKLRPMGSRAIEEGEEGA